MLSKLCDHASKKNRFKCWQSIKTLSIEIGRHPRTIKRSIKSLNLKGYIYVEKRKWSDGVFPTNMYTINIEKLYSDNEISFTKENATIINFPNQI